MGRRVSIAKQISVNPSETKYETLLEINAGQTLKVERVQFDYPTDAKGYVYASIYKGNYQVVPTEGEVTTYFGTIQLMVEEYWESGTSIRVKVRNTDNTASHQILVVVEGVYE